LKELINKAPPLFSKRGKIIISALCILAFSIPVFVSYYQSKMYDETINAGRNIKTSIINIGCNSGRSKSRLYFRDTKKEVKHVNVSNTECQMFKIGDTISVYENTDKDWYEIDPSSLK
jgi:hypothetical protein